MRDSSKIGSGERRMIASTTSTTKTGCCASCAPAVVLPALFFEANAKRTNAAATLDRTRYDRASISAGHCQNENLCDDTSVAYTSGLGTLYDRRRRHQQRIGWPSTREIGSRPTNATIHHHPEGLALGKQPPVDRYRCDTLKIERQQQEQELPPPDPRFLHLSLRRRSRLAFDKKPPAEQLPPQTTMGQRFGRQQGVIEEVKTPSDEDKSPCAVEPRRPEGASSLLVASGQQGARQQQQQWSPQMNGCASNNGQWWACSPSSNGALNSANDHYDHYYHQYLCRQPYATIMKSRLANHQKLQQMPSWQERQQQMKNLVIGDRLANFYDAPDYGMERDRQLSPCRQILNACATYDLSNKRQWADIPATPRLVRASKVRQQSPLASTPLLQKRHQDQKNGGNYWPVDDYYSPSSATPSCPSSPAVCRTGRVLPLSNDFAENRQPPPSTSQSASLQRKSKGLEPPPPTPEEAEDCLAAHLRVICHEPPPPPSLPPSLPHQQWPQKHSQNHSSPFDLREFNQRAATMLGSTDVLLSSHQSSQHSTNAMPSNRHLINGRPTSGPQPFPPHHQSYSQYQYQLHQQQQHTSGLRQSQESLMSLMSTSSTSMVVAASGHPPPSRQQHYHHQYAGGSSVGSQSPSVLVRGPGRHSHHYGAHHHQNRIAAAGPSSSCGSSSRGSSECSFNIGGTRRHVYRRSARNLNVRIPFADSDQKSAQKSMATSKLIDLKPLPCEVPCVESSTTTSDSSTIFVGREWIFHELYEILVKATSAPEYGMKGAVIYGGVGTGKTAVLHQLASYSPFLVGDERDDDPGHDSPSVSPYCVDGSSPSSDRVVRNASHQATGNGQQQQQQQPKNQNRTSNSTDSGFVSGSKLSLNNKQQNSNNAPSVPNRHFHQQQSAPPRPPLPDWHRSVCQSVVAYHFCQIENQITCTVPEFLRNLASMFSCSPHLTAYREYLTQQPKLEKLLSMEELLKNPLRSFRYAVTDPLMHLRKCGKIGQHNFLILIDGLDEAEFHRPEFGDSIASFLVKHSLILLPDWLKLVLTVKTASVDLLKGIPLHKINLDDIVIDEWVFKDSKEYIRLRIGQSSTIQTNISNTKPPSNDNINSAVGGGTSSLAPTQVQDPNATTSACPLARFATHLASGSKGNFLYMKLTLNLIEKNYLVMKGANYKVLPINLAEVFLLMFNLRFPTARAFERVAPLLNAVLASLKPLTGRQLYEAAEAGVVNECMSWDEFQERLKILEDYLVKKQDGTYVLFHPSFRDWLIRREDGQSPKYLCDLRYGHALLALRLSRMGRRLEANEMQELGHHLLKAHIYKRAQNNHSDEYDSGPTSILFGRDCQLLWLNQTAIDLRSCLCTQRNACYPNSKVSRLLLLAGASADAQVINFRLDVDDDQNGDQSISDMDHQKIDQGQTPLLCSAAFYGQQEFASLLLEFGADAGAIDSYKGRSPLMLASAEGHLDMVQMLHQHGAKLSQIDNDHRCALVYAAERGHAHVVSFLLQCDWTELTDNRLANGDVIKATMASSTYGYALRQQAAQQAFVAAAASGRTAVCEFLLDFGDVLVDEADPIGGETALSAACASARKETVGFLLNRAGARAAYGRQAEKPTPPLLQAVANGCWEIVSTLLARQNMDVDGERNGTGQTALMIAAQFGHIAVLELLLSRSVDLSAVDDDGRTALYWACLKDQPPVANLLLDRDAELQSFDKHGFGPVHYAAQHGSKQLMQLLLDRCPQLLETPTNSTSRLRPLDLAILADNVEAVQRCLKKGAKLAPSTWTFARDKLSMIAALLNKLLEDGQLLYKRNRMDDAQHRFTYALKKLPTPPVTAAAENFLQNWSEFAPEFDRLKFNLQLNYARCQRKNGEAEKAAETCSEAIQNYQQSSNNLTSTRRQAEKEQLLVEAFVCRARCFCELRQFEKAGDDLRRALRVSPTNREAQQLLPKVKMALENEATINGGKNRNSKIQTEEKAGKSKIESDDVSSMVSVYTAAPQSSRESSSTMPVITDTETNDNEHENKNGTVAACAAAASPNRSQASSDSGNMPDIEEGERVDVDGKKKNGVETQL